MTRHKFNAKATVVDGIRFASMAEAKRYGELKLSLKAKRIAHLECQPVFPLIVNGVKVGKYVADFRYVVPAWDYEEPTIVVEDVKGMKTPMYRLKKKIVEAQYGITITEIRA